MNLKDLEKHLKDWQNHNFLTSDQAQSIRQFEVARAPKSRLMLALTILAMLSIGLGIISLIAANWVAIPAWFKLLCYFSLMLGQVYALTRWDQKPGLIREGLHFLYILSILAGIGLIAQIFHVPSDGWRGMALWSMLGLGIMLRAQAWYTVLLWYASFIWAWLGFVFQSSSGSFLRFEYFILVLTVLSILASCQGRWSLPQPQRSLTLLIGSFVVLIIAPWFFIKRDNTGLQDFDYAVALILAAVWLGVLSRKIGRSQLIAAGIVALGFLARCLIADMADQNFMANLPNFLDTIAFIGQLSALGLLALHFHAGRIFDGLTLLMAVRILVLFFTLFGSLMTTGAGLILFGAMVLALLHVWYRYHDRLQSSLKDILR